METDDEAEAVHGKSDHWDPAAARGRCSNGSYVQEPRAELANLPLGLEVFAMLDAIAREGNA